MGEDDNNKPSLGDQVKEKVKEEGKKKLKAVLKKLAPFIIKGVLCILGICAMIGLVQVIAQTAQELINAIANVFTGNQTAIEINDEQLDELIALIEATGIDMEDLELLGELDENAPNREEAMKKAKRKYIKMFFEAQIITQELKRGNDNMDKQGHVYLYPESTLGRDDLTPYETLTYLPYDKYKQKIEENAPDIQEYFSVNPQGQLVLATLITTTVEVSSETEGQSSGSTSTETTYEAAEVAIDYKSLISQYATPMAFFLDLGIVTRNPEFLADVVELVKAKTNIQLTVLNTTTTEINTQIDKATTHVKGNREVTDETGTILEGQLEPYRSSTKTTTTTKTTVVTEEPTVKVTSVDTWVCSQKIKYSKIPGIPIEDSYTIPQPSETEPPLGSDEIGEVSWITREPSTVHNSIKIDTYDSGIASDYTDNTDAFINLLDNEYRIPNSKEKRTAGNYLRTDAELFYNLLSQSPETASMELVMRYIMNKYVNGLYGEEKNIYGDIPIDDVTSIFDQTLVSVTGNDINVKTTFSELSETEKELVITEASKLRQIIDATYSGQARENLRNNVSAFLEMQNKYNVNAVFAIAVTIIESSGGTNWSAIAPSTHNWMSVTGSYNGQTYRDPDSSNKLTWRVYSSYREATLDFGNLIANSNYYFKAGRDTVKEIAPTYCNAAWGERVVAEMRKMYKTVGISVGGGSSSSGTTGTGPSNGNGTGNGNGNSAGNATGTGYSSTYSSGTTKKAYKEYKQNRGSYSTMIHGYSGQTIAQAGCNITSIATVLSGYGYNVNPGTFGGSDKIINTAAEIRKYAKGTTGPHYGSAASARAPIMQHLKNGGEVIINVNASSDYTSTQHWMPLLDIQGNQVYVSNPYDGTSTGWNNIDNVLKGLKCYILVSR